MVTGQNVQQSGNVTPGHLASWTVDGILQDAGIALLNFNGALISSLLNVNFNVTNNDNVLPILLPSGYTRYRLMLLLISGATAALNSATCGLFTAAAAGGVAVVTSGTALTITSTLFDTNNNMQSLTINNQNTLALNDPVLYFRTQTAQGSAALANVSAFYHPLP